MTSLHPTARFSDKVEDYARYRPSYPRELVAALADECGAGDPGLRVADIGSGTGILSELLLEAGHEVFGVEPNEAMRKAGERSLARYKRFHSVAATAESTRLPSDSFDLVTAAQAFHWFDFEKARREFLRILGPQGLVALIWNNRETESAFGAGYEDFLLRHSTDYKLVRARGKLAERQMERFFGAGRYKLLKFPNSQVLDWTALWGRFLSTSYSPKPGAARDSAEKDLRDLFSKNQKRGRVAMRYDAELYVGRPRA